MQTRDPVSFDDLTQPGSRPDLDVDLVAAAHEAFRLEPMLPAILSIDLDGVRTEADLLAGVLSAAMPSGDAQARVRDVSAGVLSAHPAALASALADVAVTTRRNFEPGGCVTTLLYSRGIHALLGHRVAHGLWVDGRRDLALGLKTVFGRAFSTDIHPAARFGAGVWLDHGLGFVVGETAVVEDEVSIWHGVTLGSTLKDSGERRHPRLRRGATIGADVVVLGSVEVGEGSVVAAGSVVLADVAPWTTVAGVPARPKARSASSFPGFAA